MKALHLFTQKFPYYGGETFLEGELPFLLQAYDKVYIYPREKGDRFYAELPERVVVQNEVVSEPIQIRNLLKKNWIWMLKWLLSEIIRAPHRFRFLKEFSYNWNRWVGLIREASALHTVLKQSDSGIYYSYWFNEWATAMAICREQGLQGRMVARMHGYDFDEKQNGRGYFPFRRSELKAFDGVHQISRYGLNHVQRQYPWYKKFNLNRLGVQDNGMTRSGEGTNPFYIVSCSNFVSLKRIPLLIETLGELKNPFKWVHFGAGAGEKEVKELAERLLPVDSFQFMGYVPNAAVLKYYREQKVDAFINMSELEGIPMSMMEAIASGIPIIGCDVCGVPEIVTEETGLLLPSAEKPGQIARKITEFLTSQSRNLAFRQGVKAFWKQHFNAEINYNTFVQHLTCAE
ncbi:MAG: glycosyltransferase [Sphingomonadales bacterium]|nr:glycosyltransferase [Sphingomonadales bacterium]